MYFITKICSFTLEGCLLRRSQAATRLPDCVICPSLCWFVLCGNESAASLSHTNSKSRQKKENSTKFQSLDKIKKNCQNCPAEFVGRSGGWAVEGVVIRALKEIDQKSDGRLGS